MVAGVFPAAKLGALFLRQISKPIANFVKERAKHNYYFRTYVCMPPAQFYNWCEVRVKLWYMNMGKPDSIPRLNEQMAIELGSNLLGEAIVFTSAAGLLLLEYNRQVRKEDLKEETRVEELRELTDKIRDLSIQVETHDAQVRRMMHMMAEIDSRMVKIPWKGPLAHSKDDKHEFEVTKEETKKLIEKKQDSPVKTGSRSDTEKTSSTNNKNDEKKR